MEFVKEIYTSVFQTFRYITRRNNIVFDSIEIFDINEKISEINLEDTMI